MAKVLIIEDDPLMFRMYQKVFQLANHQVVVTTNGEDGISQAKEGDFTVILLDVMMPKMNGLDVLKQLKADHATEATPVIILTNSVSDKVIKAAMSMGATEYILKSDHDPMDVVKIVEQVLEKEKKPAPKPKAAKS